MKMTMSEFARKFRITVGDGSADIPDEFIINAFNWAVQGLPSVPKLDRIFSKHYHFNLDANGHYKWNLNADFRRISNLPMLNFYTSTGGEPCKLKVCYKDPEEFYGKNGIVELKMKGKPCEYTIEVEGDDVYLVFDRPLNIPVIVDYIAYGYLKPVETLNDEIELSAIAEPLVFSAMKNVWLMELEDYGFAQNVNEYLDNKLVPEAIQQLHKRWGNTGTAVIGEF